MRIPDPRLLRLSSLVGGAIMERGDGEVIVSPVIAPSIEVPSPIDRIYGAGVLAPSPLLDSGYKSDIITQAGVAAATNLLLINFAKGLWKLTCSVQFMFTGTSSVATFSGLNILDPDGNVGNVFAFSQITGVQQSKVWEFTVLFQRDNFLIRLATGATVAGDLLALSGQVYARRML